VKPEEYEDEDEIEEYRPDNHDRPEEEPEIGCIQLMRTFVVCRNKVYIFTIGRRTIVGKVIDIRRRFMKAVVETESGRVYLDLRKVSVIQEATQED